MKNTLSFNDSRAIDLSNSLLIRSLLSELCLTLVLSKLASAASPESMLIARRWNTLASAP